MMKTSILRPGAALMATALLFTACQKSDLIPSEQQTEATAAASQADAQAEAADADVFDNVMGVDAEVGTGGTGVFAGEANPSGPGETARTDSSRCFTVSYAPVNPGARFPLDVIIDFGTGCTGRDGRTRKGKVITRYSGPMRQPGSTAVTTFDGYKVDSISVSGKHTITNTSTSDLRRFRMQVEDGRLTHDNGYFALWNKVKVLTQIEGLGTPDFPRDDVFSLTGSSAGQITAGSLTWNWKTEITEPLIKRFTCRWIVKGVVKTWKADSSSGDKGTAVLNYGSGDCDNKAVLTVNGRERQITLQ